MELINHICQPTKDKNSRKWMLIDDTTKIIKGGESKDLEVSYIRKKHKPIKVDLIISIGKIDDSEEKTVNKSSFIAILKPYATNTSAVATATKTVIKKSYNQNNERLFGR